MKPTTQQIEQTIRLVRQRLAKPDMDNRINRPIKEGYTETVEILTQSREPAPADRYLGIESLSTQQGRAIAVLAVDYLLGDCEQKVLVNVPLKLQR